MPWISLADYRVRKLGHLLTSASEDSPYLASAEAELHRRYRDGLRVRARPPGAAVIEELDPGLSLIIPSFADNLLDIAPFRRPSWTAAEVWIEAPAKSPATLRPRPRSAKVEAHLAVIRAVYEPGLSVSQIMALIAALPGPRAPVLDLKESRQRELCAIVGKERR